MNGNLSLCATTRRWHDPVVRTGRALQAESEWQCLVLLFSLGHPKSTSSFRRPDGGSLPRLANLHGFRDLYELS